jgi:hypothetical protein
VWCRTGNGQVGAETGKSPSEGRLLVAAAHRFFRVAGLAVDVDHEDTVADHRHLNGALTDDALEHRDCKVPPPQISSCRTLARRSPAAGMCFSASSPMSRCH